MTCAHNDATLTYVASDDTRVGPAGEVLAANIRRLRTAERLSYAELSRTLTDIGRPIPELGLRRIELGERRVDYDDLLALCYVLKVCPVDLMVDKDATTEAYPITPAHRFESDSVREWVRGADIRLAPVKDPEAIFATPGTIIFDAIQWMPTERRKEVMRRWLDEDEQEQS
jgi:transcriptional regulator with XRE-family HTH domain